MWHKILGILLALMVSGLLIYKFVFGSTDKTPSLPKEDKVEVQQTVTQNHEETTTESTHITFKGTPIDGQLSDFTKKLRHNGFISTGTEGDEATLRGKFGSYAKCKVNVRANKYTGNACLVRVTFPDCYEWEEIYASYSQLKGLLKEKYGEPSECVEEFRTILYNPNSDDLSKMQCLRFDECNYKTVWTNEKGHVVLRMDHDGILHCFNTLTYIDAENYETTESELLYDL